VIAIPRSAPLSASVELRKELTDLPPLTFTLVGTAAESTGASLTAARLKLSLAATLPPWPSITV